MASPSNSYHRPRPWRGGHALHAARTCYDHLAGRLGVALADTLIEAGYIILSAEGAELTPSGKIKLRDFGAEPAGGKRVLCRACLDWSERRPHIAGQVGAALAARCLALGWIERQEGSRAVSITQTGYDGFASTFGLTVEESWGASVARCPPDRAYRLCSESERLIIIGT